MRPARGRPDECAANPPKQVIAVRVPGAIMFLMRSAASPNSATDSAPAPPTSGRAQPVLVGVMSPPTGAVLGPGVMATHSRSGRGLMELHSGAAPFEWSQDGVTFLWLLVLILAFVLSIVLLGHGVDRP